MAKRTIWTLVAKELPKLNDGFSYDISMDYSYTAAIYIRIEDSKKLTIQIQGPAKDNYGLKYYGYSKSSISIYANEDIKSSFAKEIKAKRFWNGKKEVFPFAKEVE